MNAKATKTVRVVDIAGRRVYGQDMDRPTDFREVDTVLGFGHETPGAGGKLFDLQTVIGALSAARAQELDGIGGLTDLTAGKGCDQVQVASLERRDGDHGQAPGLRQGALQAVAQGLHGALAVPAGVPLVDRNHQGPPLVDHQAGDRQVLLLHRRFGLDQQNHDLRETHGAQGVGNRQLFQLAHDLGPAAEARGVDIGPSPFSS